MIIEKICTGCKQVKAISEFTRDKLTKDGLKHRCRPCLTQQKRESRHRNPIANQQACKRWAARNPEKVKGYGRKYRSVKVNRERAAVAGKKWAQKNRERCKYLGLRACLKRYGLTPESYGSLLEKQNNCCAICQEPSKGGRLSVDHCHRTGRVRGVLCKNCNTAIGLLRDAPSLFFKAIEYLKRVRCES